MKTSHKSNNRDFSVRVRFTDEEYLLILEKAEQLGVPLATFCYMQLRQTLFNQKDNA